MREFHRRASRRGCASSVKAAWGVEGRAIRRWISASTRVHDPSIPAAQHRPGGHVPGIPDAREQEQANAGREKRRSRLAGEGRKEEYLDFPNVFYRDPELFDDVIEDFRLGGEQRLERPAIEERDWRLLLPAAGSLSHTWNPHFLRRGAGGRHANGRDLPRLRPVSPRGARFDLGLCRAQPIAPARLFRALFPVPGCAVFGRRRATAKAMPDTVRAYSGLLPMRDARQRPWSTNWSRRASSASRMAFPNRRGRHSSAALPIGSPSGMAQVSSPSRCVLSSASPWDTSASTPRRRRFSADVTRRKRRLGGTCPGHFQPSDPALRPQEQTPPRPRGRRGKSRGGRRRRPPARRRQVSARAGDGQIGADRSGPRRAHRRARREVAGRPLKIRLTAPGLSAGGPAPSRARRRLVVNIPVPIIRTGGRRPIADVRASKKSR